MEGNNEQYYRGLLRPKPVRHHVLPSVVVDMVARVNGQEDEAMPQQYFARYPIRRAAAVRGDGGDAAALHTAAHARLEYLSAIPDAPPGRAGRDYKSSSSSSTAHAITSRTRGGGDKPRSGGLEHHTIPCFGRENSGACSDAGMDTASERKDAREMPGDDVEGLDMEVDTVDLDKALLELQLEFRMRGHRNQNIG